MFGIIVIAIIIGIFIVINCCYHRYIIIGVVISIAIVIIIIIAVYDHRGKCHC